MCTPLTEPAKGQPCPIDRWLHTDIFGASGRGCAYPLGAPSTLVGPTLLHRRTSSSYRYLRTPKPPDTEAKT